jgi:hypothetical protein
MFGPLERHVTARGWRLPSPRAAAKLIGPLIIIGVGEYVFADRLFGAWTRFAGDLIGFAAAVWLAVALRGRWRDAMISVAAILMCFAVAEAYAQHASTPQFIQITEPPYMTRHPVLGWGLEHAGRYHHVKLDLRTRQTIVDVEYTIDAHQNRRVLSAATGPAVAFFGDSMTFGESLPDADTLPQAFADRTERRLRVLDFGVPGYGPQQFLRAVETGLFDDLLKEARAFVYETAPWHADRTACIADFVMLAPRYLLADGVPKFSGQCRDRWSLLIGRLFTMPMYVAFVEPTLRGPSPAKIDLYTAILIRAGALAREKYGVPTVILYMPVADYLVGSGITDEQIMERLSQGGLVVVDAKLDQGAFPGQPLGIPGEGHPTGVANRARAALLRQALGDLGVLPN